MFTLAEFEEQCRADLQRCFAQGMEEASGDDRAYIEANLTHLMTTAEACAKIATATLMRMLGAEREGA